MTSAEADLLLEHVYQLRDTRNDRDAWRLLALVTLEGYAEMTRQSGRQRDACHLDAVRRHQVALAADGQTAAQRVSAGTR